MASGAILRVEFSLFVNLARGGPVIISQTDCIGKILMRKHAYEQNHKE